MSDDLVRVGEAAALAALEATGTITPTELRLHDPDLSFERYEAIGGLLGRMYDASKWWIGDWLNAGEALFGERAAQAAAATKRSEITLLKYGWVCRNVPPSRRRERLSFTHHELVARFDPVQQARWLEQAEREDLSSADLNERIKAERQQLAAAVDVQAILDRAARRLSDSLPDEADIEITARLGEQSYHATIIPSVPAARIGRGEGEIVTCPLHGSKPVERIVAGVTYLTCGCLA